MENREVYRLWRVDWVHLNGYLAPSQYLWLKAQNRGERKKLNQWAKENSRLADFPDEWYFTINFVREKIEEMKNPQD